MVISRLIKVKNSVHLYPRRSYVAPFPYYNTFYGYYGAVYPVVTRSTTCGKKRRCASRLTYM
jgi:hypothetical protein